VISTKNVYDHLVSLGLPWQKTEKLIQELAWRDYWQQVWIAKGNLIMSDLKNRQTPVTNYEIPLAIINANTGIEVIDNAIQELYETGYMHNHMRMYVASICTNIAKSHWLSPAKWMYSHLFDGDLASNHLSWQWVAGTNSNKKYYANQDNINKFFQGSQKNTFLDIEYEQFGNLEIPDALLNTVPFDIETSLPKIKRPILHNDKTTLIYNYYNLDPFWHPEEDVQRVLLLENSFFKENPVSQHCLNFVFDLAKNIDGIEIFVGDFTELLEQLNSDRIIFKEHPTNRQYQGKEEPRDWLCDVTGYFPSFFAFWKKCKKALKP
jgi:deoxyribodipyrimidine photo-lyase